MTMYWRERHHWPAQTGMFLMVLRRTHELTCWLALLAQQVLAVVKLQGEEGTTVPARVGFLSKRAFMRASVIHARSVISHAGRGEGGHA